MRPKVGSSKFYSPGPSETLQQYKTLRLFMGFSATGHPFTNHSIVKLCFVFIKVTTGTYNGSLIETLQRKVK